MSFSAGAARTNLSATISTTVHSARLVLEGAPEAPSRQATSPMEWYGHSQEEEEENEAVRRPQKRPWTHVPLRTASAREYEHNLKRKSGSAMRFAKGWVVGQGRGRRKGGVRRRGRVAGNGSLCQYSWHGRERGGNRRPLPHLFNSLTQRNSRPSKIGISNSRRLKISTYRGCVPAWSRVLRLPVHRDLIPAQCSATSHSSDALQVLQHTYVPPLLYIA